MRCWSFANRNSLRLVAGGLQGRQVRVDAIYVVSYFISLNNILFGSLFGVTINSGK